MRPVTPSRARASNRAAASSARLTRFSPSEHPMLRPNSSSSHGAIGSFPDQSGDSLDTPRLDFGAWRAFFRSNWGGQAEVTEPNALAGWMPPLSASRPAAPAAEIPWVNAAMELGCNLYPSE